MSKSKKGGKGNRKGKGNEREFAKRLSKWFSSHHKKVRDDLFWHTGSSGARATQRSKVNRLTSNAYGDITGTVEESIKFTNLICIELKRGYSKDLDLLSLIDGKCTKHKFIEFWEQSKRDKEIGNRKYNWLIIRRDYKNSIIAFDDKFYSVFKTLCGKWKGPLMILKLDCFKETIYVLDFEEFLKVFDSVKCELFIETYS